MGVGQSRELLGKVSDDRVFVCTNREELLDLLTEMQSVLMPENDDIDNMEEENEAQGVDEANDSGKDDNINNTGADDEDDDDDDDDDNEKKEDNQKDEQQQQEQIEDKEENVEKEEDAENIEIVDVTPIEVIHIPNHYLGDEGLIFGHPAVLQVLAASTSLRSLNIGFNSLTARSVAALLGKEIENLNNKDNDDDNDDNDDDDGNRAVDDVHLNNGGLPPNLLSLNLAGNTIGREGCELLAGFLARDPPLRELSLFHNGLYDSDVEPLLHALKTNTHLRLLNLDYNFLTGGFLRQLLELLKEHNSTLAVVLFDGPYDMETFERKREIVQPEKIPDASQVGANARALLRQKLLRADLSGRIPFPADLVQEVETILAPRRAEYIAELEAEKEAKAEKEAEKEAEKVLALWGQNEGCSPISSSQGSSNDEEGGALEKQQSTMEEGEEEEEKKKKNGNNNENVVDKMGNGTVGGTEGLNNDSTNITDVTPTGSAGWTTYSSKTKNASAHTALPEAQSTERLNSRADDSITIPPVKSTRGRSITSVAGAKAATAAAATEAAQAWRSKRNVDTGKELSNGFDRLVLAPPILAPGAKTVWHRVEGPPCRLRACWCDPRDAPVPYGGQLHYHCKHEPTGGELGDMGADGVPLAAKRTRVKHDHSSVVRQITLTKAGAANGKRKKTIYEGCKETSHRCESLGFYGRPKPDMSSVYFFASRHPMQARALVMDNDVE
ncbi:uncharacterized protein TM35_000381270 [Trypanosoma theileri]|uniref:Leucine-rich repeat protein (LRRP) n=1 Tax=Trypanosoma theileri TaxID=67003 RepID=A0A1X0NJX6_9TRYP|nr:uncharacterized protein TM35_000381270 [Trypanosoma theileri]ORC85052.1 hypothetical protein TM35_000381270 [Trypanosoma theileri]